MDSEPCPLETTLSMFLAWFVFSFLFLIVWVCSFLRGAANKSVFCKPIPRVEIQRRGHGPNGFRCISILQAAEEIGMESRPSAEGSEGRGTYLNHVKVDQYSWPPNDHGFAPLSQQKYIVSTSCHLM